MAAAEPAPVLAIQQMVRDHVLHHLQQGREQPG